MPEHIPALKVPGPENGQFKRNWLGMQAPWPKPTSGGGGGSTGTPYHKALPPGYKEACCGRFRLRAKGGAQGLFGPRWERYRSGREQGVRVPAKMPDAQLQSPNLDLVVSVDLLLFFLFFTLEFVHVQISR